MFERVLARIRRHPRGFDAVVAAVWIFLTLGDNALWEDESGIPWFVPLFAVAAIVLYWRRRWPLPVFVFIASIVIVMTALDVDDPVPAAIVCASYSLGAHAVDRRHSVIAFFGFVALGFATVLSTSGEYLADTIVIALTLAIAWVIGDSLRTRRAYNQSVLDRAERAEELRDSLAHQAVAEERTRIARDLHDVVAHSMSLMVVQAGAARRVAATDPAASIAALKAIESVGRNSLDEMRRILDVLRNDEGSAATAPQPDIAAIQSLMDEFRTAGLPVTMTQSGDPRPLPPSVELTAYRIVQESLTNTLKHAGPATATIVLDFEEASLRIEVEDTGGSRFLTPTIEPGSQKGHLGMRERVAAFGGFFDARPRLDGGFHVTATLPFAEPIAAPDTTTATNGDSQ